jgi:hypothetical protein
MATLTVPFNKLAGVFRKYGVLTRRETPIGLTEVVNRAKVIVTSSTRNAPPASPNGGIGAVNYLNYLKAWQVKRATLNGNKGVLVGNTRVYAPYIDYGRKPGRAPPVDAIALWAVKKLNLPYAAARKIAWPIARAIAKRGLRPRGVLHGKNTTQDFLDAMEGSMGKALSRAAQKLAIP